ncbi:hypothetical protein LV84_01716 [Algoriphagus ratkowskyi]|uniref:Uncharacterized protein n=1 Tax=Algoriphagus ratkowskyi TaxID=57028 RepID=A0A2W7R9J7_9BACT|nr:hypothetical protein LV84_01716 [Algoriphagus ratkowskyi]
MSNNQHFTKFHGHTLYLILKLTPRFLKKSVWINDFLPDTKKKEP